jgi:hypothetical protein
MAATRAGTLGDSPEVRNRHREDRLIYRIQPASSTERDSHMGRERTGYRGRSMLLLKGLVSLVYAFLIL